MDKNILTFNIDSDKYFLNRPRYPKELYKLINENCKSHDIAWDSACGNGQVSIDLIPYFSRIEATDINDNQINNSFKHDKINYSIQNSENTNFQNQYFDVVCVAQSLHWFNAKMFFLETKRVLKKMVYLHLGVIVFFILMKPLIK